MELLNRFIFVALAACLLVLSYNLAAHNFLPFDAAYNFLTYKNLADFGQFEHRYGLTAIPFNPVVSTGPTVNGVISLVYRLVGPSEGVYVGTGLVSALATGVLALSFFTLGGTGAAVIGSASLALISYVTPYLTLDGTLFTGLGEFYAVVLTWLGLIFICRPSSLWRVAIGGTLLGAAILTKVNLIVGIAAPVALWALTLILDRGTLGIKRVSLCIALVAAAIAGPSFIFKRILPRALLTPVELQHFKDSEIGYHDSIQGFAFYNVHNLGEYIQSKNPDKLNDIKTNLDSKVANLRVVTGGTSNMVAITGAFLAALVLSASPFVRRRYPYILYIGVFSLSIFTWWFFCNHANWYRYLSPAALAFVIMVAALAATLPTLYSPASTGSETKGLARLVALLVVGFSIWSGVESWHITDQYAGHFDNQRRLKSIIDRMAEATNPIRDGLFFGWGWFQSPEVRAVTSLEFLNLEDQKDIEYALKTDRRLFMATGPINFSVANLP